MQPSDMEYPLCWVAYFDLLGFRRIVEEQSIWRVQENYKVALDEIRELGHWTPARWFSDTFLFYTEDDSSDSFGKISGASDVFFLRMLRSLIPVRGCLTFGKFHAGAGDALFGPALIEAWKEAEAQDWLGLILTPKAEDKMKQYEINGRTAYDVLREYCYRDYDVPFTRKDPQSAQGLPPTEERRRRMVYTMNIDMWHGRENPEFASFLWADLDNMQHMGEDYERDAVEKGRIRKKYENTKAFLMDTVPKVIDYVRK